MATDKQKRQNARFPIEQTLTATSNGQHVVGVTRDVNAEGVFFFTSGPIVEGSRVEVLLSLPAGSIFSDAVTLRADGKAVRIENADSNGKIGVAVAFEHIQIDHSVASISSV